MRKIQLPLDAATIADLNCGDAVSLSGEILTARDAAHARMTDLLNRGQPLPIDLRGSVIYYVGPTPAKPGEIIGSAGPTTSSRMDRFTPQLLEQGLAGMIGKGNRGQAVINAMKANGAVYFAAAGGAGAWLSEFICAAEIVAYADLGAEAICRLSVTGFPVVVAIDARGRNLYEDGRKEYLRQKNADAANTNPT